MLRVLGNSRRLCSGLTRRELLQAGGLGLGGLTLPGLLEQDALQAAPVAGTTTGFGRAKSCIVLFLYGAWSQQDTLDMKPGAPAGIRGEFSPIATSLPGTQICEHLPRLARWLDRATLVRSMTHSHPTHCVAYALTGIPQNPLRDPRDYWPCLGSTLDYLWDRTPGHAATRGVPRNMCLPWELNSRSRNRSHRGLTAAWLGSQWEPIYGQFDGTATREAGHPSADGGRAIRSHFDPHDGITPESTFRVMAPTMLELAPRVKLAHKVAQTGLELPEGVTVDRLNRRRSLLEQFDRSRRDLAATRRAEGLDRFRQMAFDMLTSAECSRALDVTNEPRPVRDRYGHTLFGQATLAARRLIEAGSRIVTVYWDEFGPENTGWDTHVNNFPRLREGLCPTLDRVYTALLEDLQQRGLLEETVVLLVSEHGRTPKIGNKPGGAREHWSYAYSGLFAGAGIRQGQVIGATDKQAGYPVERPVNPKDILATLYHLLGFHVETTRTYDSLGRPHFLLPHGQVIPEMLTS